MPQRILVVDDDPDIREIVHATLAAEGFIVTTADSAGGAERLLKTQSPDLILLDIMMENRDSGHQLCRTVVRDYDIPVIFLTARATDIDTIVGLELGADDYVTKPFNPRVLAARVRAALRTGSRQPSVASAANEQRRDFAGYEVDEGRLTISTSQGQRTLSRIEFFILKALASDIGRVFSRDEIIAMVYEEADAASPRTVDSHVRRLRSKMNEIGEDPIKTVRGVGYKIQLPREER